MLMRYGAWADELIFAAVAALPEGEATRERPAVFGNMVHTLNHGYVIDRIWQAHLEGRPHGYTARNTKTYPPLDELWRRQREIDAWYVGYADRLPESAVDEVVRFTFVGGGEGAMTRGEILMHVVNHKTYHRGHVADLMMQVPARAPATDLPVFLRDAPPALS
jgi:uncharacterized damage-inducible protein DinB